MLERPDLTDGQIVAALRENYNLAVEGLRFLPVGNDSGAWSFRVDLTGGGVTFLKVRRGVPDAPALLVPHHLRLQGITEVIAALPAVSGELWQPLDSFGLILYPYVEGKVGMEVGLTHAQWRRLGAVVHAIHTTRVPGDLAAQIPHESFVPWWSETVRRVDGEVTRREYEDVAAGEMASFWRARSDEIARIVDLAEQIGRSMQARAVEYVLCHADMHTANVLVDAQGGLSIVDWDGVMLAPKERDLMFMVDHTLGAGTRPRHEECFFEGYGEAVIDPTALAYYRFEWVVQELGDYAARVFLTDALGAETRADAVRGLVSLFDPGNVVEAAYASEWR